MKNKPDIQIRPFQDRDLPRLHEIREAAYRPVFRSFRNLVGEKIAEMTLATAEDEQGEYLDRICRSGSNVEVFVVESDRQVVGFCGVALNQDTKIGEIDLNSIHPNWQNKNIGTAMYNHALDHMRQAGMQVATVGTGGDESHAAARRAYHNAGFSASIPNVIMYREL